MLTSSKVKRILLDYRKQYSDDFEDLKTQLNLLDNGYGVDLSKISNSLLQGTLQVCFSLMDLPQTNRGYFWDENEYNNCGVFEVLGDCFEENVDGLEAALHPEKTEVKDENALDLDELEEEEEEEVPMGPIGPERPPPPVMETPAAVGPVLPEGGSDPYV